MKFGHIEIQILSGGKYRLDGGAMYGIIPKVLWERKAPADAMNRIVLECNCPLIRVGDQLILIDTGCGSKFSVKEREIYGIEKPQGIVSTLARVGVKPEEIDYVIPSHLHFDHIGGGTSLDKQGNLVPTFPNAKYVFQRGEWEDALQNVGIMKRSYLPENLLPLEKAKMVEFIDGDKQILPGLKVVRTGGHTQHHQVIELESEGKKGIFFGDLIPTTSHLPDRWIMAYDVYPMETMSLKRELLKKVVSGKWMVLWDHDPKVPAGIVTEEAAGNLKVTPVPVEMVS